MPSDDTIVCPSCKGERVFPVWAPLPPIDEAYQRNPVERESYPSAVRVCDVCLGEGRVAKESLNAQR